MDTAEVEAKARELWEASGPKTHKWPTWESLPEDWKVIWRHRALAGEEVPLW